MNKLLMERQPYEKSSKVEDMRLITCVFLPIYFLWLDPIPKKEVAKRAKILDS